MHRENDQVANWEVFEEINRKGDGEGNAEERGNVSKLLPEGIAESLAGVPGIEVERHETDEDGSYKHPIDIHKDSYADGHKAYDFLYYLKIKEDVATTQYLKHV